MIFKKKEKIFEEFLKKYGESKLIFKINSWKSKNYFRKIKWIIIIKRLIKLIIIIIENS